MHKAFCHLHDYHRYHCGFVFIIFSGKNCKNVRNLRKKNIKIWKYVILTAFYYKPLQIERLMWSCLCLRMKIFANFQHNAIHTIILFLLIIIITLNVGLKCSVVGACCNTLNFAFIFHISILMNRPNAHCQMNNI